MEVPRRILLVRLSHLGDCVHALVCHHALHAAFPKARIAWAIQPEFAGLLEGLPGVDRILPFERRAGIAAWPRLRRRLRSFAPDWTVDAQGNLKSAAVTWLSGARRRSGLAREDWREPFGARVLNDPASPSGAAHAIDRMRHLARHVAGRSPDRLDPGLRPEERARGGDLLLRHLPPLGRVHPPVLLQVSSPGDVRSWPLASWARLARDLVEAGHPVLVLSGPGEEAEGRHLEQELPAGPSLAHWVGQRGVRDLAAVFAAAAERGGRLVGCDSGPVHLAAACGLSVTCLEGPQSASRTGPWPPGPGGPHTVVTHADPPPCAPCLRRTCDNASGPVCMEGILPEQVLATCGARD